MTASTWLYSSSFSSEQLAPTIASYAAKLRTPTPVASEVVASLVARHNATLQAVPAGKAPSAQSERASTVSGKSGRGKAGGKSNGGQKSGAPLYRLINQDAQLTGAAATANQQIQAILQQYQAKKEQAKSAAPSVRVGPQFFLESALDVSAENAGVLLDLCHQLNHTEFKVNPGDDLQQLNSVEGLYQLPLWALRLKLAEDSDLSSLELMVLPQDSPTANYRGPLVVVLRLNFAETSLCHLTTLAHDEAAQVSCAALLLEAVAQVDTTLLDQAGAGAEICEQCYDQVVRESLSEELLEQSLLLAPYFKPGTTVEARYQALKSAACALGYALTHLDKISAANTLTPLPSAGVAPVTFESLTL